MLATLLLTVLTLVGGAATASGAGPAAASRSLVPAVTPAAPGTSQTHRTGHHTGRAAWHRAGHDSRHRAGHGAVHDFPHRAGHHRWGPDHANRSATEPDVATRTGHEHQRAADPAQSPRAGTGRAYLLLHAPPPPHDALTPAPPGPARPPGGVRQVAADSFDVPGSRRGALPGVRGPPGRSTGPTTGRPSCSADPASRPH
ncbi:hypothetical protein [Streptomyces sp. NPDC091649]|uniref:hypothetical protein n=1 Tax=Streptomyces sp. NPDC091649 TaxID=3366004 RepID=UPI00380A78A9